MVGRLIVDRDGPVLTVRFHNPPRHFFDEHTGLELARLMKQVRRDPAIRVLVFTGNGDSFVTHADVPTLLRAARSTPVPVPYPVARVITTVAKALAQLPAADRLAGNGTAHDHIVAAQISATLARLPHSNFVTIAAINELALGMGAILALACDLRIIADHAQIGLPESALGISLTSGGTQHLVGNVGVGRALELLLDRRWIDAHEAVQIGLVHRAVPGEQLLSDATDLAHRLAGRSPAVVRATKRLVYDASTRSIRRALAMESASFATTMSSKQVEPLLASYNARLAGQPHLTDDAIRGGWPDSNAP